MRIGGTSLDPQEARSGTKLPDDGAPQSARGPSVQTVADAAGQAIGSTGPVPPTAQNGRAPGAPGASPAGEKEAPRSEHRRTAIKICGLRQPADIDAALDAGASYLGFVFFPRSPRAVTPAEAAALSAHVPAGRARVGLFVNPDDTLLDQTLAQAPLDLIQLHGAESPARVAEVRVRTGLPVMKAVGVATAADLDALWDYGLAADLLLLDAKPAPGAMLPGGNGLAFDWRLLAGRRLLKPWFLAGGLTPANVAEAVRLTGAPGVDVSSGVESAPGRKDPALIAAFCAAVA